MFHLEWEKLNKITTNVHGSNTVNSTGGIMIHELKPGFKSTLEWTLPLYDQAKSRSLKVDTPETLSPLFLYSRVGQMVLCLHLQRRTIWYMRRVLRSTVCGNWHG